MGTKLFNIFYEFDGPGGNEVETFDTLEDAEHAAQTMANERLSHGAIPTCELCEKTEILAEHTHCDECSQKLSDNREAVRDLLITETDT